MAKVDLLSMIRSAKQTTNSVNADNFKLYYIQYSLGSGMLLIGHAMPGAVRLSACVSTVLSTALNSAAWSAPPRRPPSPAALSRMIHVSEHLLL